MKPLCFPPQHLVVVLSLVGQVVLLRRRHLILDVVAYPCSFVGRRYCPRKPSSCDKSLHSFLELDDQQEGDTHLFASRTLGLWLRHSPRVVIFRLFLACLAQCQTQLQSFPPLIYFLPNRRIPSLSSHDIYYHSRFLGCLDEIYALSSQHD